MGEARVTLVKGDNFGKNKMCVPYDIYFNFRSTLTVSLSDQLAVCLPAWIKAKYIEIVPSAYLTVWLFVRLPGNLIGACLVG